MAVASQPETTPLNSLTGNSVVRAGGHGFRAGGKGPLLDFTGHADNHKPTGLQL